MAAVVALAGGGSIYDGNSPLESPLTLFIAQLVIICTLARVLTKLFSYIKRIAPSRLTLLHHQHFSAHRAINLPVESILL
jgi:hypothetical protein